MSEIRITNVTNVINFSQMEEKEKDKFIEKLC